MKQQTVSDLHNFKGHPGQFWPAFLTFACQLVAADKSVLLQKNGAKWKVVCQWSAAKQIAPTTQQTAEYARVAASCLQLPNTWQKSTISPTTNLVAVNLISDYNTEPYVAIFHLSVDSKSTPSTALKILQLLADSPAIYQRNRASETAEQKLVSLSELLDLQLLIGQNRTFTAAVFCLVNECAARYQCSRVGLGWAENGYVKLKALSHTEEFEPKMDAVASLEAAMEETLDQQEEILLTNPAVAGPVKRAHQIYAKEQQLKDLVSIPLLAADQVIAVLTFERQQKLFTADDVRVFRLLADLISDRFAELKQQDLWFGARWKKLLAEKSAKLLGPENSLLKVGGLLTCILLILSMIIELPYRVEAPFILRSQDVRQVTAPFAGYIEDVFVKIGQQVEQGQLLLTLDDQDLLLEESAALANRIKYLREAEKARAKGVLIEMRIAEAQAEQAEAQLKLAQHRLQQSQLTSAMNGIIVDGDLEELRGAPVSQGDLLFKIARIDNLFVEMKVPEEDIHELAVGLHGELAFVSRPEQKYPLLIEQIDPTAQAEDAGNVFRTRAGILQQSETWWRPGMSGIAKISVAERSVLWILSHRTLDFLQLLIWW